MNIAILAWGSLVWQPKELKYDESFGWKSDGPILPIEFARISKDGRLTLVITPNGTKVQTLYTLSGYKTIDEAVSDLRKREGSLDIGRYDKPKKVFLPENFAYQNEIREWIKDRDFDAVIWTNLGEKWEMKDENGRIETINIDERIDYLKKLNGPTSALAEQYIRRAPKQINTKYRTKIEEELDWFPIDF